MGYIGNGPYQGVLTGGNIQDGTVETTDLADGAVTTVKIADASVTATKLAAGAAVPSQSGQSGKYLTTDGSTASWGTVDLSSKVSKTGDTMTGNLLLPGLGVDTDSDSHVIRMSANASQSSAGVAILQWGKDMSTWGGDIHYLTDSRGVSGQHRFWKWDGTNFVQTMGIDSSGRVTMPYQPAVTAYPSSPAAAAGGDSTHLVFGSTKFNNGNHYNTSTGIFTCPVAGYYFVSANIRWETQDFAQTSYIRTYISKNDGDFNTTKIHVISGMNEAWTNYMDQTVSGVVYCAAGDNLRLNGGENGATDAKYHSESSFSVYLLG